MSFAYIILYIRKNGIKNQKAGGVVMRKMAVVNPMEVEWQPINELPEGAWIKMLSLDEETGVFSAIFKFEKGYHEPKHTHPSDHDILILEGRLVDSEGRAVEKGMFFFAPAGEEHGPYDAPDGCVFYGYFNGPAF
jgi:quercetin dioxygenase-like cupin family protein